MKKPQQFESLAGITPGLTTLGEVIRRWGTPVISSSSDGGIFSTFPEAGIRVCTMEDSSSPQAIIEEVALLPPSTETLPCGLALGHPKTAALRMIHQFYEVTEEYEDAIYF